MIFINMVLVTRVCYCHIHNVLPLSVMFIITSNTNMYVFLQLVIPYCECLEYNKFKAIHLSLRPKYHNLNLVSYIKFL